METKACKLLQSVNYDLKDYFTKTKLENISILSRPDVAGVVSKTRLKA